MALTTRLPTDACPSCGKTLDAATNLDHHTPEAGDVTVCLGCQSVLEWDENMKLRLCDMGTLPPGVQAQVAMIVLAMKVELPRYRHQVN